MAVQRLVTELAGIRRQQVAFDANGKLTEAPRPNESSVVGFAGDVLIGAAQGVGDMIGGVVNLIVHPITTIKGLVMLPITLITRPGDLVRAFTEPYTEAIQSGHAGRAIGRGIVEIGTIVLGPKLFTKAADAIKGVSAGAKAGEVAGAAGKAGQLAETAGKASKAGKVAETAAKAGKVAEAVAGGQKITVVVGTEVGKAAKAAKVAKAARVASKAKKVADAAAKAGRAAKATKAGEAARKAASAAAKADRARKAAEAARLAKQAEEAARVASAAEKTAEAAKTAARASKVTRTAKAAKFVKGTTASKAAHAAGRSTRVERVVQAVRKSPDALIRETRRVNLLQSSKIVAIPGKGSMRISHLSYESVREVRLVANGTAGTAAKASKAATASKAAKAVKVPVKAVSKVPVKAVSKVPVKAVSKAPVKVPVKVANLKAAKPFTDASARMSERAARLAEMGKLEEARRLEALAEKLRGASKLAANGDKAKALSTFRSALGKKGTLDALKVSNKAEEVFAAFGKTQKAASKASRAVTISESTKISTLFESTEYALGGKAPAAARATSTAKTAGKASKAAGASKAAKASKAVKTSNAVKTSKAAKAAKGGARVSRAHSAAGKTPALRTPVVKTARTIGVGENAGRAIDGWFSRVRAQFAQMGGLKVSELPGHLWGLTTSFAADLWAATTRIASRVWPTIQDAFGKIGEFFKGVGQRRVGEVFRSPFAQGTLK